MKKKSKRKYKVEATIKIPKLAKALSAIELKISARGKIIGSLTIGRGSLIWYPKKKQTKRKRISWGKFSEMVGV